MTNIKISKQNHDAAMFDMDGVITDTAGLHARAWKEVFDRFLERLENQEPFDLVTDYRKYVDGKPRYSGVVSFLSSRNLELESGEHDAEPGLTSINAIANLKTEIYLAEIEKSGVTLYQSTVELIKALKENDIKVAVVTASEHGEEILSGANLLHYFDAKVDGKDAREKNLKGKPDPDVYLEAARMLNVEAGRSVVLEDATSGVEAGKNGGFNLVIGVAREDNEKLLLEHGAHVVVKDLCSVSCEAED